MKTYYLTGEEDLDLQQNICNRQAGVRGSMLMEALTRPQTDRDGVGLHKMLFNPLSSNKNIVVILS